MTPKNELPIADLHSNNFGSIFNVNNRSLGFNAVTGFEDISSSKGNTIQTLKERVYIELDTFDSLDDKIKKKFHTDPTGQRGYTPDGVEQSGQLRELRSHIMLARPLPEDHPLREYQPMAYRENAPIDAVPNLNPSSEELLECLDLLTLKTFENVERNLDLPFGEIASKLVRGQSFLRLHMYPAAEVVDSRILDNVRTLTGEEVNGVEVVDIIYNKERLNNVLRASPHPDTGYFTWLLGSEEGGLYIQLREGSAMAFKTKPGVIVGNAADFISTDLPGYRSTIHWVGLTEKSAQKRRLSIANFVHPRPSALIGHTKSSIMLYDRLEEIGYFGPKGSDKAISIRDELIRVADQAPTDSEMISKTLLWENQRGATELGRYFHLSNSKTGAYERKSEPTQPLV